MKQRLLGTNPNTPHLILFAIFFLFFFQLISDFVEAIYAFGLLGTSIPPEIVSVLFLFSPTFLFFFKGRIPKGFLLLTGGLVLTARVAEVMLDTRGKMIVSGLGVAAFMLFFPGWLINARRENKIHLKTIAVGVMLGVSLSILFKSLNSSVDLSTHDGFGLVGLAFALLAGYLLWQSPPPQETNQDQAGHENRTTVEPIIYSLGLFSILMLLYFALTSPNVIARWTGVNYLIVLTFAWAGILGTAWLWFRYAEIIQSGKTLLAGNLVFVVSLILTILPHQINFPVSPEGFPLLQPRIGWGQLLPLYIMLLTYPILFLDFERLLDTLLDNSPATPNLAVDFLVGGIFLLLVIFFHVFTTVYDYIPVVGPFFRDKFWFAYFVPGIILISSIYISIKGHVTRSDLTKVPNTWFRGLAGLAILSLVGVQLVTANPSPPPTDFNTIRVLTYNIQQGYDENGAWNFDGQLDAIRRLDPDIIGLQESDTNRIAGGNKDVVQYFADHLDMYAYYGPSPVTGTFGIALLSKFPIQEPRTYFLYSTGEQVAVIEAKITSGEQTLSVYVNHLGNGGPLVQQQQFLEIIAGKENVIAMGDYNFRPETEQYALTIPNLNDSYLLSAASPAVDGFEPDTRIDHIFVSPGMNVIEATYFPFPESDHPALLMVLGL